MRKAISNFLSYLGIGLTTASNLKLLKSNQAEFFRLRDFVSFNSKLEAGFLPDQIVRPELNIFSKSTSQLNQDLIALMLLDFLEGGFFVEFGATDGMRFSNTYLLESSFNWRGILAEPGKSWHPALQKNRKSIIEKKCVWRSSGEILMFNETEVGELSTLEIFSHNDMHANSRSSGARYEVETISLNELLESNNAPLEIDYLSIDTEGSELQILEGFDFNKYSFNFISCEHNFTDSREGIKNLLESQGYVRILEEVSEFDDWYIKHSLAKTKGFI